VIELKQIRKVFLTDEVETHALADINLVIHRGEFVAIAGPSGCGKSTLLSILGLLDSPSGGDYTLNGKAVANLGHVERALIRNREVGFIFQSFNLIGDLTVFENVELPLTYRGMSASERRQSVDAALERVGDVASDEALSVAALRRSAATYRCGSRTRRSAHHSSSRRAHRESRFQKW